MANIYNEQVKSDLYHQYYTAEGNPAQSVLNYGEQMQKQAQQYEDKAKVTYANAIEVEASNVMNELINDPSLSANPALLEEKMNTAFDKMAADIVDDDVKIDFLAKTSVKKSSYLNKAYANAKKVQDEQYKSSLFNSIYANIDGAGLSFMNGLTGNGSMEDVQNFQMADQNIVNYINTKDEYGSFIFSDEQRLKMAKDYEKIILDYFKSSYETMDDKQKENLLKSFENDMVSLGSYSLSSEGELTYDFGSYKVPKENKDKNRRYITLDNVVSSSSYADMKRWALEQRDKERKARISEHNLAAKESILSFMENPTQVGLDEAKRLNPFMSDDTLVRLEDHLLKNSKAKVSYVSYSDAKKALDDVTSMPEETQKQQEKKIVAGLNYIENLMGSQHSSELDLDDKNDLKNKLIASLADNTIGSRIAELPDAIMFGQIEQGNSPSLKEMYGKRVQAKRDFDAMNKNILSHMMNMVVKGESKEAIYRYYEDASKLLIKKKYWYIPDIQNKKLEEGKTKIELNGVVYTFEGFSGSDILVRGN